jgi:hypothetical protein
MARAFLCLPLANWPDDHTVASSARRPTAKMKAAMTRDISREMIVRALAEPNEDEAFAQILYSTFGGIVDWNLLPHDSRSKDEYREKARHLLKLLDHYRERHGKVPAPLELTPEMIEAGYRAMLAARPGRKK